MKNIKKIKIKINGEIKTIIENSKLSELLNHSMWNKKQSSN